MSRLAGQRAVLPGPRAVHQAAWERHPRSSAKDLDYASVMVYFAAALILNPIHWKSSSWPVASGHTTLVMAQRPLVLFDNTNFSCTAYLSICLILLRYYFRDLSMILCDPYAVNTVALSAMKAMFASATNETLPRVWLYSSYKKLMYLYRTCHILNTSGMYRIDRKYVVAFFSAKWWTSASA